MNRTLRAAIFLSGAFAAAAVLTALLLGSDDPVGHENSGRVHENSGVVVVPETVQALVHRVDLIVIARVDEFIRETQEGPLDQEFPRSPSDVPPLSPVPFTYYRLTVEETVASKPGVETSDSIILRIAGSRTNGASFDGMLVMPQEGDRMLYLLSAVPGQDSYGLATPLSVIDLTGSNARFHTRGRESVSRIGLDTAPDAMMEVLKEELLRRSR